MSLTVAEEIETHLNNFHDWLSLRPRSKDKYTEHIRSFYHHTGRDTPLNPQTFTDLDKAILTDDLTQHISCRTDKFALKKYFDWLQLRSPTPEAERTILFFKNKVDGAEISPDERNIDEKVLSVQRVRDLCEQIPANMRTDQQETRLVLQMMYDTATRISGMLWLEWQDVWREEYAGDVLADNELLIHHDRSKSKKSGIVELSDDTVRRLEKHEQQIDPDNPRQRVFYSGIKEASAYQKIYRNFKNTAKEKGVPDASPHWFRHSRLTHLGLQMRADGKSYPAIKERLRKYGRHRSGETTEIYIKILKNRKTESVQKYSTISW